jgi:hypothetical protein
MGRSPVSLPQVMLAVLHPEIDEHTDHFCRDPKSVRDSIDSVGGELSIILHAIISLIEQLNIVEPIIVFSDC